MSASKSEPEERGGKARLLKAAQLLVQDRSFDEITIEEIIQQAKLSRPAFYYHFAGGKEELRQALVEHGVLPEMPTQDVRQDVIKAALRVYARSGISAATLEDIATEAGVTKSTLSWHFHSKEDLLISIMKEYGPPSGLAPAIEQFLFDLNNGVHSDYETIFRRLAEAFYDAFNVQKDYVRLAMLLIYTHPEIAQKLVGKIANGRKYFTDQVRKCQGEGLFRRDIDPAFLTQVLAATLAIGAIGRGLFGGQPSYDETPREVVIEQLVSLLLYGIVRRDAPLPEDE